MPQRNTRTVKVKGEHRPRTRAIRSEGYMASLPKVSRSAILPRIDTGPRVPTRTYNAPIDYVDKSAKDFVDREIRMLNDKIRENPDLPLDYTRDDFNDAVKALTKVRAVQWESDTYAKDEMFYKIQEHLARVLERRQKIAKPPRAIQQQREEAARVIARKFITAINDGISKIKPLTNLAVTYFFRSHQVQGADVLDDDRANKNGLTLALNSIDGGFKVINTIIENQDYITVREDIEVENPDLIVKLDNIELQMGLIRGEILSNMNLPNLPQQFQVNMVAFPNYYPSAWDYIHRFNQSIEYPFTRDGQGLFSGIKQAWKKDHIAPERPHILAVGEKKTR